MSDDPGWQAQPPPAQPQHGAYPPPQYGYPQQPPYPGYYASPVSKPLGWFIVNWLFFWPTAIYSLVQHWGEVDRAAYAGDIAGAQRHADAVKRLGIWALCIGIAVTALVIVIDIAVWNSVNNDCGIYSSSC